MGKFKELKFDEVLPRLVTAHYRGKLVPFTGSGISAPSIPTWAGFLQNLYNSAQMDFIISSDDKYPAQQLIQSSEKIVTKLLRQGRSYFAQSVRNSLGYTDSKPLTTSQCKNLAAIWWPLILSTNYDTMLVDELQKKSGFDPSEILLYGRSKIDCHSLLASLKEPSKSVYWALQGFFGTSHNHKNLEDEIVVGYTQYRNVTYDNQTFRSVFAEVYRNHSLFFLGTGLSEDYFKGLFGEVLEKFGSNPYTHIALFNYKDIKDVDHHFLHTKFNITAVFYDDVNEPYDGLSLSLEKLGNAIRTENQRLWKLGFSSKNLTSLDNDQFSFGLEILAGSMPSPRKKECNVFSAGSQGSLLLSGQGKEFINKYYSENGCYDSSRFVECKNKLVSRYAETDLFAAVARDTRDGVSSSDSRNLKKVSQAIEETLKETNGKYEVINVMLLAAGKGRIFPPVYSFIQMIRGYKNFIKNHDLQSILKIHVVDPSVTSYFRTNSLEIEELLNCDDMRINIEIQDIDEIERYQIYLNSEKSLETVSEFYSINRDKWNVRIAPTPFKNQTITPDCQASLEDIGLIPGSMIIYSKK